MSKIETKLRNWIKYSVIFTGAPFIFALVISNVIGSPKSWLDMFPDLILTVFSIGVNAVSYIADIEDEKTGLKRIIYVKDFFEFGLIFFLVLYFGVFNIEFVKMMLFKNEETINNALHVVYITTWGFGILYSLSIVIIEIIASKSKKLEENKENE